MPALTRDVLLGILIKRKQITVTDLIDVLADRGISSSQTDGLSPLVHELVVDGLVNVGETQIGGAFHVLLSLPGEDVTLFSAKKKSRKSKKGTDTKEKMM